jgi:hypothetical protein
VLRLKIKNIELIIERSLSYMRISGTPKEQPTQNTCVNLNYNNVNGWRTIEISIPLESYAGRTPIG